MEMRIALRKIFIEPRWVFSELNSERKWVPAVVFMAVLLGVHGFVTAFGTYSQNPISDLIENRTPVEFETQDVPRRASDFGGHSDSSDEEIEDQSTSFRLDARQIGRVSFVVFMSVVLVPVAFGLLCGVFFVEAIYFRIVSALLQLEFSLSDWFAFCAWSRVPAIALSVVAIIVGLIALGRQPTSEDLEVLRLTRWIYLPEVRQSGENWNATVSFYHLDAQLLWVIVLQTIGFSVWTGKKIAFSFCIALIPTLIIVAIACVAILVI